MATLGLARGIRVRASAAVEASPPTTSISSSLSRRLALLAPSRGRRGERRGSSLPPLCQSLDHVANGAPGLAEASGGLGTIYSVPYRKIDDPVKLRRLLEAVLLIESEIDLASLLRHIVEEACSLVAARYGALGVLNESRTGLSQFVTFGLLKSEEAAIGPRPTGRGVLGLLVTDPRPLRLRDLTTHPDSYGFPDHHPTMTSFLGLPVRVRGEVYGNLYLTEKKGGAEFSEEDESMAEALALAAGIAIENYRLNERVRVLSVLDDRDRIARDLHDRVIQRVYAVGMTLQETTRSTTSPRS